MSGVAVSKYISDWLNRVEDDGVYTVNAENTAVTCSAGAGTGRSYARKFLPVTGGETITFTFLAKRISGTPKAAIDYPFPGQPKDQITVDSDDWQEYQIACSIPHHHNDATRYVQVLAGVINNDAGEGEFANMRIDMKGGGKNPLNCHSAGLIKIEKTGGVATAEINENFHTCGIRNLEFVNGSTLVVTGPTVAPLGSARLDPIFFGQLTTERYPELDVKIGVFDSSSGEFTIKFTNNTTSFVDMNTYMSEGEIIYLSVMAVGT